MNEQTAIIASGEFLAPVANVRTALERYQAVKDFIGQVLKPGTDYGTIPGAGDKPALLKPGAEKMCSFFGLTPRIVESERVEDWTGKDHEGEPFFYYRYRIGLYRGERLIAEGEGSANSWEKKYRYRNGERVCPNCGKSAIIKGQEKYGGGWLCFAKKGGCGAKFGDKDQQIIGQEVGQVKNPDVADIVNTLQKMAQKRALIAPVLIATNTSDYFTQDIEDFIQPGEIVTEGHATEVTSEQPATSLSGFKTTAPVQTPAKMTPRPAAGLDGLMTPKILVDNGYCKDIPEAAKLLNALKIAGKPAAEGMEIVKAHFAKSQPQADNDVEPNDYAHGGMPDPRTGDGENR